MIVEVGTSYSHDRFPNQDDFMGADARHMCGLFTNFGMRSFRNAKNVQDQGGPMPIMTAVALSMLLLAVTGCVDTYGASRQRQKLERIGRDSTRPALGHKRLRRTPAGEVVCTSKLRTAMAPPLSCEPAKARAKKVEGLFGPERAGCHCPRSQVKLGGDFWLAGNHGA